jgi:hypothetical protein
VVDVPGGSNDDGFHLDGHLTGKGVELEKAGFRRR